MGHLHSAWTSAMTPWVLDAYARSSTRVTPSTLAGRAASWPGRAAAGGAGQGSRRVRE